MIITAMSADQRHTSLVMTLWMLFLFAVLQIAIIFAVDVCFARRDLSKSDRAFYCLGQCVVTIVLVVAAFIIGFIAR